MGVKGVKGVIGSSSLYSKCHSEQREESEKH